MIEESSYNENKKRRCGCFGGLFSSKCKTVENTRERYIREGRLENAYEKLASEFESYKLESNDIIDRLTEDLKILREKMEHENNGLREQAHTAKKKLRTVEETNKILQNRIGANNLEIHKYGLIFKEKDEIFNHKQVEWLVERTKLLRTIDMQCEYIARLEKETENITDGNVKLTSQLKEETSIQSKINEAIKKETVTISETIKENDRKKKELDLDKKQLSQKLETTLDFEANLSELYKNKLIQEQIESEKIQERDYLETERYEYRQMDEQDLNSQRKKSKMALQHNEKRLPENISEEKQKHVRLIQGNNDIKEYCERLKHDLCICELKKEELDSKLKSTERMKNDAMKELNILNEKIQFKMIELRNLEMENRDKEGISQLKKLIETLKLDLRTAYQNLSVSKEDNKLLHLKLQQIEKECSQKLETQKIFFDKELSEAKKENANLLQKSNEMKHEVERLKKDIRTSGQAKDKLEQTLTFVEQTKNDETKKNNILNESLKSKIHELFCLEDAISKTEIENNQTISALKSEIERLKFDLESKNEKLKQRQEDFDQTRTECKLLQIPLDKLTFKSHKCIELCIYSLLKKRLTDVVLGDLDRQLKKRLDQKTTDLVFRPTLASSSIKGPTFVLCLCLSRLGADVREALTGITEQIKQACCTARSRGERLHEFKKDSFSIF